MCAAGILNNWAILQAEVMHFISKMCAGECAQKASVVYTSLCESHYYCTRLDEAMFPSLSYCPELGRKSASIGNRMFHSWRKLTSFFYDQNNSQD